MYSRRKFIRAGCSLVVLNGMIKDVGAAKNLGVSDEKKLADLINGKTPLIWLFTGASIAQGAKHTHGFRSFPEIFAERIRWEMSRFRDVVINTGISGNTTKRILDDFDWRVKQFSPSIVSLMIGTNDCSTIRGIGLSEFESNVNDFVRRVHAMAAIPILHTPNSIISRYAKERLALPEYVAVIREVAQKRKVILVDNWLHWKNTANKRGKEFVYKNWLNDPLHPNGSGHIEIARQLFMRLSIFDENAPTCNGRYYEGTH